MHQRLTDPIVLDRHTDNNESFQRYVDVWFPVYSMLRNIVSVEGSQLVRRVWHRALRGSPD